MTTEAPPTPDVVSYPLPVLMGRVLADVPAVGKNSQAPANMGGYAFRGIEDVLAALKPAMARHGVFCIPDVIERLPSERPLGTGKIMFVVDLFIRWTFHGPAGDTLTSTCWGQGTDMGDKATQKAMTSAFKSMLMQTFCIGDAASDAEAHDVPDTQRVSAPTKPKTDGWESAEQEAEAHKEIRTRLAQLPEDHPVRIAGRVMREKHGWPVALERLAELRDLLDEAERPSAPAGNDEKAPSAPQTVDSPSEAPTPAPAEKPKRTRSTGPAVTCVWCGTDIADEAALPVTFEGKSAFMHGRCRTESIEDEQTPATAEALKF